MPTILTLLLVLGCGASLPANPEPHVLLAEADAASRAGDPALALAKLEAARSSRPDYPRIRTLLARAYVAAGRPDDAVGELHALATFGLSFAFAANSPLATLREHRDWPAVSSLLSRNAAPQGAGAVAFVLPARDGIIESITPAPGGGWFIGDVRHRCVWHRAPDGTLRLFAGGTDSRLTGVFGLVVDERRGVLWIGCSALREMSGYTDSDRGRASLVQLDLRDGSILREFALPADGREHVLGSLALGPDGHLFATDSASPVIWRLDPDQATLEPWVRHERFRSLQGLAFNADGTALHVADYGAGLWHIPLATRQPRLLPPVAGATLFAVDDLRRLGSDLIAVQNGFSPHRVVRLSLDRAGDVSAVTVLEANHPALTDAGTGCLAGDEFVFIGHAGWELFSRPDASPAPRDVTIFRTKL